VWTGGDAASAVDYFERALELQPRASSVHHALGLAYRQLGDLERAELHLGLGGEAPVQLTDPNLSSITRLGRAYNSVVPASGKILSGGGKMPRKSIQTCIEPK